jgi:hypothetical protein
MVKELQTIEEPTSPTFARVAISNWFGERFANMPATNKGKKSRRTHKEVVPALNIKVLKSKQKLN